jgi:hypothetical protein
MIYSRTKNRIKIAEIWYDASQKPAGKPDVLKYKFVSSPGGRQAVFSEELFTILVNLNQKEEDIFSNIRKNTRYEINRARERDAVECITFLDIHEKNEEKLGEYIAYFNEFASAKKRGTIDFSDLKDFYEAGAFCVRAAVNQSQSLVYTMHAYIIGARAGGGGGHVFTSLRRIFAAARIRNLEIL